MVSCLAAALSRLFFATMFVTSMAASIKSRKINVSGTLYKNITIREPIMVPIATISFRRPVCSTSATLSRSLVTRLKISPALFRSKNRKGSRFSLQEISVRREQVRVSATHVLRLLRL